MKSVHKLLILILCSCGSSNVVEDELNTSGSSLATKVECSASILNQSAQQKINVANSCLDDQKYERAYFLYKKNLSAITDKTIRSRVLNNMGVIQTQLGHHLNARIFFEESMNAMSNDQAIYNMNLNLVNEGFTSVPESIEKKFLELKSKDDSVRELQARIALRNNDSSKVKKLYSKISLDPKSKANFEYALSEFGESTNNDEEEKKNE